MIGTLGDVAFTVSASKVLTFQQLARSGSARYQKHDVISTKPVLEFIGPDLDTITLPIRLDAALGVNPLREITRLKDYKHNGTRLTLIVGGNVFGDFVIDSLSDTWDRVDHRGALLVASVNLSLQESVAE